MIAAQTRHPNWKPQYHRGQPNRPQFNRQRILPLQSASARQTQLNRGQTHGDKLSIICHYCKKPGHFKSECRKLMRKNTTGGNHSPPQHCNVASISFMAIESTANLFEFVADSGCTSHMSPRHEWFREYKSFVEPIKIRIGDDSILLAFGSGTIKTNVGKLTNCYHVPDLCANLFSISVACDLGIDFQFDQNGIVGRMNNQSVLTGYRSGSTYVLDMKVDEPSEKAMTAATLDECHSRLAYMPKELILKMAKSKLIDGLKIVSTLRSSCVDWALNKCKRVPHPVSSRPIAERPNARLHFDIVGPVRPEGLQDIRLSCSRH